jgi:hypothetical protein
MDLQALSKQELQKLFLDLHGKYMEASKDHSFSYPKTSKHIEAINRLNEVMDELAKRRKAII